MTKTEQQFNEVIEICSEIFFKKFEDYGTAWRVLRPQSLTDQIYIKAQRIRTLESKESKIKEGRYDEYIGIINYCIMALIQLELNSTSDSNDIELEELTNLYNKYFDNAKQLMLKKNHDYDEVWRSMRISSYTDLILMKIIRTKEIEDNDGKTLISEGIDANYYDMLNYSVFALIKLNEQK